MQSATKVIVISVHNELLSNDRLLDHNLDSLRRSGLNVEAAAIHRDGEAVSAVIQDAAIEGRADLLIAGAYGHSTVREAMFGGVTRGLLDNLRIPVLLSH
jgi:nucleotide-binding universal stress UspA family protein